MHARPVAKAIAFATQASSEVKHADPSLFLVRPKQLAPARKSLGACRWSRNDCCCCGTATSPIHISESTLSGPMVWQQHCIPQTPSYQEQHELYFQEMQTFKLEHSPARSKYPEMELQVPEELLMTTEGGGGGSML